MNSYNLPNGELTTYEVVSYLVANHMGIKASTRAPSLEELTNTLKSLSTKTTLGE